MQHPLFLFYAPERAAFQGHKAHKVLDHLAGNDEPCHRGHKGVGAWHGTADSALALGPRRADTVVLAADGIVLYGGHGRLPGVDHLQVFDLPLAALGAHDLGKGAHRGLVDVGDLKPGGIHLVACTHGADDGGARLLTLHHQRQFAGDRVDGVHHIVVLGKIELILGLRSKKALMGGDLNIGVDVVDALLRHLYLVLSHGAAGGNDLTVQVGQADLVVVDKVQRPHAADAEHRHPGAVKLFHRLRTQQQLGAGILILHILLLTFPRW